MTLASHGHDRQRPVLDQERAGHRLVRRVQRLGVEQHPTTAAATTSLAHQRQRGEGSDPVGVSSSTNPSRVDSTTQLSST